MDHTAFPDIIDTILSRADVDTLLQFRGTSKAYLDRCNRLLLAHVAVAWLPREAVSTDPALKRHEYTIANGDGVFILTTLDPARRRLPFITELVPTLDIVCCACPPPDLLERFTNLRTIRRRSRSARMYVSLPRPVTVVDIIDLFAAPKDTAWLVVPPDTCAEYIVHLNPIARWRSITTPTSNAPPYVCAAVVTLVLWPPRAPTSAIHDLDFVLLFIVLQGIFMRWHADAPMSLTIVGMESYLPPRTRLRSGEQFLNDMAEGYRAKWGRLPDLFTNTPRVRAALERGSRLISRKGWLLELGERRHVLGEWVDVVRG